jgi:hypothetical protein
LGAEGLYEAAFPAQAKIKNQKSKIKNSSKSGFLANFAFCLLPFAF